MGILSEKEEDLKKAKLINDFYSNELEATLRVYEEEKGKEEISRGGRE